MRGPALRLGSAEGLGNRARSRSRRFADFKRRLARGVTGATRGEAAQRAAPLETAIGEPPREEATGQSVAPANGPRSGGSSVLPPRSGWVTSWFMPSDLGSRPGLE